MIVFIDNPNLINLIVAAYPKNKAMVFNLSSLYSGYTSVTSLITGLHEWSANGVNVAQALENPEIDMMYWNLIMSKPKMFESLVRVVFNSFEGNLCLVLIQHDPYRDSVLESLIKLIQQRYGFTPWIVNDIEDISVLEEPLYTAEGLNNIDTDRQHYHQLFMAGQIDRVLEEVNLE